MVLIVDQFSSYSDGCSAGGGGGSLFLSTLVVAFLRGGLNLKNEGGVGSTARLALH